MSRAAAEAALAAYGLADAALTPIRATNNDVYEVRTEDGRRLALRVHRPEYRTAAQVRAELDLLERLCGALAGTRVSVPAPVRARGGELVVAAPDGTGAARTCSVLDWLGGRVLRPGRGLGPAGAHLLGEALARIHEAAVGFEAIDVLPRWDAEALLEPTASPFRPGMLDGLMTREELDVYARVAERGAATFARLEREGAAQGVIHADFIPGNCQVARSRATLRVGVLDFDDAGHGFFVYDLCVLLDHLLDAPRGPSLARAYLAGYRSVRRLPRALERHLPVLMAVRHATTCLWLAGVLAAGGEPVPVRRFLEIRTAEMERCLALETFRT